MSFLKLYQQEYGRFVHITKDALQVLHDYDWPGNIPEIRSICRKILATATSRIVDARFVSSLPVSYTHLDVYKRQFIAESIIL